MRQILWQLFSLYVRQIESIASFHNISIHKYANDIQCYLSFSKDVPLCVVNDKLKAFVNDMKSWIDSNHLMLNQLKTKYIEFASSRSVRSKVILELNLVHCEKLEPCASVTNLLEFVTPIAYTKPWFNCLQAFCTT